MIRVPRIDADPPLTGSMARPRRSRLRSMLLGVGVGTGIAVAGVAVAFSIVAIPIFIAASTDPGSGLDRSRVRQGLFLVALPCGLLLGMAAGIAVGVWYARGGRLPTGRSSAPD